MIRCKNFPKVQENTGKKMFAKISLCRWLSRKNNNTINCDHNDDLFSDTRTFAFTMQPIKQNFTWSARAFTESIYVAAPPFYLN